LFFLFLFPSILVWVAEYIRFSEGKGGFDGF